MRQGYASYLFYRYVENCDSVIGCHVFALDSILHFYGLKIYLIFDRNYDQVNYYLLFCRHPDFAYCGGILAEFVVIIFILMRCSL